MFASRAIDARSSLLAAALVDSTTTDPTHIYIRVYHVLYKIGAFGAYACVFNLKQTGGKCALNRESCRIKCAKTNKMFCRVHHITSERRCEESFFYVGVELGREVVVLGFGGCVCVKMRAAVGS